MTYSAENTYLWGGLLQFSIIAVVLLLSHFLRRSIPFVKKSLMPTSVLAGFILLFAKMAGIVNTDPQFLELITYHCIAIGFIAMSLRVPEGEKADDGNLIGLKSGAVIVGSYMIQGIAGLIISILLSRTIMPDLFPASGVLLPMGYGQGPGQANNIGSTYEALGFAGGRSFGLAIAASGYLCACIVGVFYINWLVKKGKVRKPDLEEETEQVTVATFQMPDELPIAESLDRFSIQAVLVAPVYLLTYLFTAGVCKLVASLAPGASATVESLLWGFNFIIGSALAILVRTILQKLKNKKIMEKQYQNNYLLSRVSGFAFDLMITAGIASIEIDKLKGLWLPFVLMSVAGAVVTMLHLSVVCKKCYKDYYYEGLVSMYGMMTGTISSGILLLRELDTNFKTPAANNLVIGSSFAIMLAAPLLVLVSLAPRSFTMCCITLVLLVIYYVVLLGIVNIKGGKRKQK